jgi:hypothetical protein
MKKEIFGIFVCMLLIIPATSSVSCKIVDKAEQVDDGEIGYILCIFFGRISNLKEEIVYEALHYTFDIVSMRGFELIYGPPFEFYYERFHETEGKALIPKDIFRGHISENLIVGLALWTLI